MANPPSAANVTLARSDLRMEDMAMCGSPGALAPSPPKRRKGKHEEESIASALRKLLVKHQLGLALNLILLLLLTHTLFPSLRTYTSAFLSLSYPTEKPGMYGQGPRDLYVVPTFVVCFTAIRAFFLDYVFMPLAAYCGIKKQKGRVRFAEQAYVLAYYAIYWGWGVYLFVQDTPSDVKNVEGLLLSLWRDFPRLLVPSGVKLYYLSQLAQWIQMIIVIHIEERRKDHWQMFTHHLVTVALMVFSYGYRMWRIGIAILVCMDLVDCIFPLAKILRYMSLQTACDAAFGVFVLAWIASRHVAYLSICWSIYAHVNNRVLPYGTYSTITGERLSPDGGSAILENVLQPLLNPEAKTVGLNKDLHYSFLGLLMALQCITLLWLVMIIRVVARVLRGEGADDSRSDDEGEAEEQDVESGAAIKAPIVKTEKPRFIEVETTSEEVSWPTKKGSSSTNGWKKSKGISSGLNLGEHKEILNRIGCLSEEQLAREREKREGSPRTPVERRS